MTGRRVLFFIDNDSARFALVNMFSPVDASAVLLWEVAAEDSITAAINWYARVPPESNIADDPSRLEFGRLLDDGFAIVQPVVS